MKMKKIVRPIKIIPMRGQSLFSHKTYMSFNHRLHTEDWQLSIAAVNTLTYSKAWLRKGRGCLTVIVDGTFGVLVERLVAVLRVTGSISARTNICQVPATGSAVCEWSTIQEYFLVWSIVFLNTDLVLGCGAAEELVEARGERPHGAVVALRPAHLRAELQLLRVLRQHPAETRHGEERDIGTLDILGQLTRGHLIPN